MVDLPANPTMGLSSLGPVSPLPKRKRDGSPDSGRMHDESILGDGDITMTDDSTVRKSKHFAEQDQATTLSTTLPIQFQDYLSILQSYDTEPSILHFSFQHPLNTDSDAKRPSKRARTDGEPTIAERLKTGAYDSIHELRFDISQVSDHILSTAASEDVSTFDRGLFYIKKSALIQAAESMMSRVSARSVAADIDASRTVSEIDPWDSYGPEPTPANSVLTVLASGPGSTVRPMFSSLQLGQKVTTPIVNGMNSTASVAVPISESILPPSISLTQIVAPPPPDDDHFSAKTIGELFKSASKSTDLDPPKPARRMTTRGNTLNFLPPEGLSRYDRTAGYNWTCEPQTTGKWLGYGGLDQPPEPSSIDAKRRQRDRALSISDALHAEPEPPLPWETRAREEAMFRAAFSSFAPSVDNLDAIIPAETKAEYWWYKYGRHRYENPVVRQPVEEDDQEKPKSSEDALDPQLLGDSVETVDIEEIRKRDELERQRKDKDTQLQLSELSDMLQTLYSYQRIRHSSLSDSLSSITGTPTAPAAAERELYSQIQKKLAEMAGTLPPYALAKINGNQLQDLAVSTVIPIQVENQPGLLEEDPITRITRSIAQNAAATTAAQPSSLSLPPSHPASVTANRMLPSGAAPAAVPFSPSPAYSQGTPADPRSGQAGPMYGTGSPMPSHHANRGPPLPAPASQYPAGLGATPQHHPTPTPGPGYGPPPSLPRPNYNPAASSPSPQLAPPPGQQPQLTQLIHQPPKATPLMNGHQYYPHGPVPQQSQSLPPSAPPSHYGRSSSPLKGMSTSHSSHGAGGGGSGGSVGGGGHPMGPNRPVYAATTGANTPVHHRTQLPPPQAQQQQQHVGQPALPHHVQMHPTPQQQQQLPPHMMYNIQPRPSTAGVPIQPAPSGPPSVASAPAHLQHVPHPHPHQHQHSQQTPLSSVSHSSHSSYPGSHSHSHSQSHSLSLSHPMSQTPSAIVTPISAGAMMNGPMSAVSVGSSVGSQHQHQHLQQHQYLQHQQHQAQHQQHQTSLAPRMLPPGQQQVQLVHQSSQSSSAGGSVTGAVPGQAQPQLQVQQQVQTQAQVQSQAQRHPAGHPAHQHPHFNGTSVPG